MVAPSERISQQISQQLYWDDRIYASKIQVKIKDDTAILRGTVPTYLVQQAAIADTKIIPGVNKIKNELVIESTPGSVLSEDKEITENIITLLTLDSTVDHNRIDISVKEGWVTLEGSVTSYWKKVWAETLSARVSDIRGITNKITITPTDEIVDKKIAEDIAESIDRNNQVPVDSIDIKVKNGKVTLSGILPNNLTQQAAIDSIKYTAGIIGIDNQIEVKG